MYCFKEIIQSLCQFVLSKEAFILKVLGGIWFFFAGIHGYMYAVAAMTILDVITGLVASLKRGEGFRSRKLRKGLLEKFGLYMVLVLAVFVLDLLLKSTFGYQFYFFSFVLTFLIVTYECTSVLENFNDINPNIPFVGGLIRIFRKMGEKTVDGLEQKVDSVIEDVLPKIKPDDKAKT